MEVSRQQTNTTLFSVSPEDSFRISITDDIFIENIGSVTYRFKLKDENGEVIGNGELIPYTWMSFELKGIQDYSIDFYTLDDNLINTYSTGLKTIDADPILLNVKFPTLVGKTHDITKLDKVINDLKKKYKCEIWVYFKGSEKYDLSSKPYSPLRMNDIIPNFSIMTTLYV